MRRKDIRLSPEHDMLEFIDGYRALIMGGMVVMKNGVDWVKYYLLPTDELAKRYDIVREMLDDNLCLEREYPKDMIETLNEDDPARKVKFCFFNFEGKETPTTRKFKGIVKENKELMDLKEDNSKLNAKNFFLMERIQIAQTNVLKHVKQNFGEYAEIFGPMIKTMAKVEKDEEKAGR